MRSNTLNMEFVPKGMIDQKSTTKLPFTDCFTVFKIYWQQRHIRWNMAERTRRDWTWICPKCSAENARQANMCQVCSEDRPIAVCPKNKHSHNFIGTTCTSNNNIHSGNVSNASNWITWHIEDAKAVIHRIQKYKNGNVHLAQHPISPMQSNAECAMNTNPD